ncbi:type II toxin-antitoxin system RelE/ParE family toxin [Mesorhizobium sp. M7A.F.Ca.CA.001.09.2.1]|uniref:Type II toxin-antitoxin system RelE/ParE family toxin n=1 Tax=Mesorhizobium ciceri TaxID=39645 RepID=A0AB38TDY4_9HYPH|nr:MULTISPECIES: type II toxin-antitoxin system RelE/ParE family toxin [Mesorhizobium]RUY59511.1 type II toxin-antitoxin system RelE/ParE family toxin [Mesorhizobium sp. M7A.F.Ca.CA.001.13.2.1]MDF3215428.1 type II toxin-antitoxin system RelE/ParE family toxin [Mesorhizobium ciceri]RUY63437.1 type II toxin-antitoxin system RelE/ParE family toxin [Mesorhizobium sp. M7A.F.Ca.CA.001.05.1.1]RUY72537.1 type II toxin-antitoxin system RelE/ParE family toxin [Mesorhizobium sp. M7A.F.Ca.CA.001.13.1.1]RU
MSKKFKFVNEGARRAFMDLPKDIRINFSGEIRRVQEGDDPLDDFKVLKGEWKGVIELRENGSPAYRALYCAKHLDTVYILHSFTKTSEKADRKEMDTALSRYKEMMAQVRDIIQAEAKAAKDKTSTKK